MLPFPTSLRFQPLRSGLINLFKYQDQEFWYERGRLLIRGNNGTGKSRVLALQLPFLLDGEISPSRVEPDGDPARQIAWHLLMDEHEQRTGYTWIEFGRRDENGAEQIVTLGCGMRAIKGGDNQPSRWFFITDRRVGRDFSLLDSNHPLNAERLGEVLGQENLFKAARDYRAAIDKRLFGVGPDRYEALIKLLIRLRAPQLAKKLNSELLFSALTDALPELPNTVVENVAAAFKDLDNLREQHESLLKLSRALATFHFGYRTYLQAALLRRAATVRSRHSEFEHAQRQVAKIELEITTALKNEADASQAVNDAKNHFAVADARFEALQQSSRAEDARMLDYAQQTAAAEDQRASQEETHANTANVRLQAIENDVATFTSQRDDHFAALTHTSREAERLAIPAGFSGEHARFVPAVQAWPVDAKAIAKFKIAHARASSDHDHRLRQIESRLADVASAQGALANVQKKEDQLAGQMAAFSETLRGLSESIVAAVRVFADAYLVWHASLRWLVLPPWSDLAPAFDDWRETADESDRCIAISIADAVSRESAVLATARADLVTKEKVLAAERLILTNERATLYAGPAALPIPPLTRNQAARAQRPGAPLWQLCEFRPELLPAQRAGLEAALEASGLLDAWVSPDGELAGDLPADTFLAPSAITYDAAAGRTSTLNDWLQPESALDHPTPVDAAVLRRVLSRIGAGPSAGDHWVGLDGAWQLGPVLGRGEKSAAIHLGATGREMARQRRLAEIAVALSVLDEHRDKLQAEFSQLALRQTEVEEERLRAPTDHEIARLLTLRTEAHRLLAETTLHHATAVQETFRARQQSQIVTEKLNQIARDLGYGEHLHRLVELRSSWAPYAQWLAQLWGDAQAWITGSLQLERYLASQRVAEEDVALNSTNASAARTAAIRAAENYRTLAQSLGATIEEYQRELQTARAGRTMAQQALDQANTEFHATAQIRSAHEASLAPAKEKVSAADQHRLQAILELRVPLIHGLFPEAHPDLANIEADDWAPTRAYAIARQLDKELPETDLSDLAWTDRLNSLNTQINDLRTLTGALGCQVVSRVLGEGLTVVTCHYQGSSLTPAHCLAAVERERETHERLLSDGERTIIDRHLVTEVSLHLQSLIEGARHRTEEMNGEMTRCATTLGVALRLVWEPVSEGLPAGLPQVRRLLLADHAAWTEEERATVGRFLHQLIQEERARDPAALASEQLLRALDYRRWHAFAAERRQKERWERLTQKRYGTGSGGEKALMLTIPQMAAASSHYRNSAAHAPRLILLDEAFAGMDKPTRARCMGLLEAFDLDLLMTSEREWGAHATLSGIAIYQLVADAEAVAATRWVWNGKQTLLAPVPDTPELRPEQNKDSLFLNNGSMDDPAPR